MKVTGFKMTYYMKNGKELVDESLNFKEPVEEDNDDLIKFISDTKEKVKEAVKTKEEGYIAFGTLYVNIAEVEAIRFDLKRIE